VRLSREDVYETTPYVPLDAWFPRNPFRFKLPASKRVDGLSVSLVVPAGITRMVVMSLDRSSKDALNELKMAISVHARVSLSSIASIKCGDVLLTDRFDVAALKHHDALSVTLEQLL
jgi:hypothetical protein